MNIDNCWYKKVCKNMCSSSCIRFNEMNFLLENSGIPEKRQKPIELIAGVDYEKFVRLADIKSNIGEFVESGNNLYICSSITGNGKTSWAIKLILKYFDEIWAGNGFKVRALFVHVPTLLLKLKDFDNPISQSYKKYLSTVDLICWDDIASTKLSSYDIMQLLNFIDSRIIDCKANIFTGNIVSQSALEDVLGNRLASRIWNCSTVVELKGKDRR